MSAPHFTPGPIGRRALLARGLAVLAAPWVAPAHAHGELGPVEPRRSAPVLSLTLHDGRTASLPALLQGRVTALQLIFTGCSAVCPVQGATFAAVQARLPASVPQAQLLSLSIDPLGDTPAALATWRARFEARAGWLAAVPALRHADVLPAFLAASGAPRAGLDRHSAQVFLFDAQGRLSYRCAELAGATDIAQALVELARRG